MTLPRGARYWLPAALYMALIFLLSGRARVPVPEGLPDAALHMPEFFVLGCLLSRAFLATLLPRASALGLALGTSIGYGLLDELHQSFVPGRVASLGDVAADGAGAMLAVMLFALVSSPRGAAVAALPAPEVDSPRRSGGAGAP